ncbi:Retrotransposon gag protein [Corchorus olitorius]|uniref:Retrotransposon gag protein n=1 Tax=Corchorus olitorius TaxID=93759 RepID=A0A1R3G2Z9_9ROSI|nr:Retrotransposon gag protein [Corchorus olitorius]
MSESVEGSGSDGEDKNLLGRMSALESKLESMMGLLKQSMQVRDVVEPAKAESAAQSMAKQRVIEIPIYDVTWWESYNSGLEAEGMPPIRTWPEFTAAIKNQFYPLGYEKELRGKWQFLRQKKGQTVQEYTTEFRKQAMLIGVNLRGAETLAKYKAGLHYSLRTELALFNVKDLDDASIKAMHMEKRAKPFRDQQGSRKEAESSVEKGKKADKKNASATRREERTCEHCSKTGHTKDRCWELHPEKKPKNWKGKRTAVVRHDHTGKEEEIEGSEYPDEKLVCMAYRAKQKHCSAASTSSDTGKAVARAPDSVKEELFWIYVQIQMSKVVALYDSTSQRNLISQQLVKQLNLKSTPHPEPYPLGWLNKGAELQVTKQCTFKFAINEKFKDEVTCDVVPLDICQVIFGSPYLWDRDAVFYRRENVWKLVKDGVSYRICPAKDSKKLSLVSAQQAKHLVNTSKRYLLLIVREIGADLEKLEEAVGSSDCTATQKRELGGLLNEFAEILKEPTGLPPTREIQHEIALLSGLALFLNDRHQIIFVLPKR